MTDRYLTGLVLVAMLMAAVAPAATAADPDTLRLEDTGLESQSALSTYEKQEHVTVEPTQIMGSITIGESAGDVGVTDPRVGRVSTTYLRFQYNETVPRVVRFVVPSAYFAPRVQTDANALNGSASVELEPTANGNATLVTITVDGPADVVVGLDDIAGQVWSVRHWARELVSNVTGFSLPSLAGDRPWRYIDSSEYGPNRSATLNATPDNLTLQYEDVASDGESEWLSVPECSDPSEQRLCYYRNNNRTVIMTTDETPPRLRYKRGTDIVADLKASVNDLLRVPGRAWESITEVFS